MENICQNPDMSPQHLKDQRQGSAKTEEKKNTRDNTSETEQRKHTVLQICDTKNTVDVPQEKSKGGKVCDEEATKEDSVPSGSAISKETLEELKHILRESPFIHLKNKLIPKTSTIIQFPKCVDKTREKPDLTFITFRPHLENEIQKPQLTTTSKVEESVKMLIDPVFQEPTLSENEEQYMKHIQQFKEKHFPKPDQLSTSSGTKYELPATELNDSIHSSSKDSDPSGNIQNPLHSIALIERIKQQIAKEDIRFVRFEAADLHGGSRAKTIPARFIQDKVVNGLSMPRSYLELHLDSDKDHVHPRHFYCDILLKPDLQTFRVLPWTDKTARVICDPFSFIGNPLLTSPRYLAKRLLNELQENGFVLNSAFTYEFCIFGVAEIINSKTVSFPAATLLSDHQLFIQELSDGMYCMGGNIESFSSSSAPGQMEVSFKCEYGLDAADTAFSFKTGLREAAKKQGYITSFFSDSASIYNSGVFLHSLWNLHGTKNLFYSGSNGIDVTDIGRKWLSGLLQHSAALSCLSAPGVACRKHFFKDSKDPQDSIRATFGSNDNSCSYNIKSYGCNETYIENKLSSATANPYLVLAATIAAGLSGIRKGLDLLDSFSSTKFANAPQIPLKLEDALSALKEDTYMRASLGEPFIQYFLAMKQYELETDEGDSERNTFLEYFI
ncbi:lengsin isoform 2-T2 [Gastrophryne carolinensis]